MRTMGNMKKSITADSDFAAWAAARSQKTNRSLAGARLAIPEPQKHAEIKSQAQQWGMTVEDATMTDEHNEEFRMRRHTKHRFHHRYAQGKRTGGNGVRGTAHAGITRHHG